MKFTNYGLEYRVSFWGPDSDKLKKKFGVSLDQGSLVFDKRSGDLISWTFSGLTTGLESRELDDLVQGVRPLYYKVFEH